jgi:predicted amidohydrolase YtcJ
MPVDLRQLDHHPNLILYNAQIFTLDPAQPWAEAIAIRGTIISAIGTDAAIRALATKDTCYIDMGGRVILPGLCDAHIHLHEWSINLTRPHLASARSKQEMLAKIADYAAKRPSNGWIVCQGWNESWWGESDFFTAKELDGVTQSNQPAIAYRSDMHIAIANSAALAQAAITHDTPNPPGGLIDRDESGQPTGVLRELAIGLVTAQVTTPTQEELLAMVRAGQMELHRLGITAIHDQRIKDAHDGAAMLAVYTRLHQSHELLLRVNCNIAAHQLPALAALGLRNGFGNDYLRLGHVKVFADGSLGSRTA